MSNRTLIQAESLSIGFRSERGYTTAVRNVSFEIKEGSTLAIVGESGSGKSVSSLSLLQLLQTGRAVFESGKFVIDPSLIGDTDTPLTIEPSDTRLKTLRGKGIAMIFQEPMTSLNPVIRCGTQVAEMIRVHLHVSGIEAHKKTVELFREVKLPRPEEMFNAYPHELSGGQRQRVMIAMAISCNPKVLIADEPTTALDVTVQKSILSLLRNLQQRYRMGMIFITHDLGVVAEIADEIAVMRKGEIVEYGKATDILQRPQHAYTKGLLASRPVAGQKAGRLRTVEDFLANTPEESREQPHMPGSGTVEAGAPLLQVSHLSRIYYSGGALFSKTKTKVHAVNDVSFEIRKGETLGLVGESGCGKTTLSRMLPGLIHTTSGHIRFNGNEVTQMNKKELRQLRKEMQIIFQDPYSSLNPKHPIGEAILEPMIIHGLHQDNKARKRKVFELLEKVGLSAAHYNRYPHEFSGGQRQRVVIARALAVEPSFVICDESVSALDVSVQAQVLNLLNDLKRDFGLTYLFVSHDLSVIYHMSDRIMVMKKGEIEEIGPAEEIFYRPQSDYTRQLIASIPGLQSLS